MDGGLLNFTVGEYPKAIGSEVAEEFQELTKTAAPLPDSPGLGEMVQQFDTKIPKLEMPKEEVDKTPKLEIPEPEEEEADNPSLDKRSKKKTPIKRKLEIKEEVADDDNPSPEKSKKVRNCSVERTRVFLLSTIGLHQRYKALSLPGIDCFKEVVISM